MRRKMRVVLKKPCEKPQVVEIDEGLKAMQEILGKSFKGVSMLPKRKVSSNITALHSDNDKACPNFFIDENLICGTVLFVSNNRSNSYFSSLSEGQVMGLLEYFGFEKEEILNEMYKGVAI